MQPLCTLPGLSGRNSVPALPKRRLRSDIARGCQFSLGRTGATQLYRLRVNSAAGPIVMHRDSAAESADCGWVERNAESATRARSESARTMVRQVKLASDSDAGNG